MVRRFVFFLFIKVAAFLFVSVDGLGSSSADAVNATVSDDDADIGFFLVLNVTFSVANFLNIIS